MNEMEEKEKETTSQMYESWNKYFDSWPIGKDEFDEIVNQPGAETFRLDSADEFASVVVSGDIGQITALVTGQEGASNGHAHQLLENVTQYFADRNVKEIKLCSGAGRYFWPGIPTNLPYLKEFFETNRFKFYEVSVDMTQDLSAYKTPHGVMEKAAHNGFDIRNCSAGELEAILEFEKNNFPKWHKYYEEVKEPDDILVAWQGDKIVGTCLALPPYSQGLGETFLWKELLGNKVGGAGSLGVQEETRGKGVGLALATKATEHIKSKGAEVGFLGWTWLVDWYGQLGYKVWKEYNMGSKRI